jgi:Transmembrane secretion effector
MQTIALSWLVLELTHSGTMIGLVLAAQFLPVLLFTLAPGCRHPGQPRPAAGVRSVDHHELDLRKRRP